MFLCELRHLRGNSGNSLFELVTDTTADIHCLYSDEYGVQAVFNINDKGRSKAAFIVI